MQIIPSPHFSDALLSWFDLHGRHNLPWQTPRTPYRVWISEVMLQQTQVGTVIPYFERFMARFPDVSSLATASSDEVLSYWSGLGYYSRARNLHQCAIHLHHQCQGELPDVFEALEKLPGIGPSTAAAIASLAFNKPTPILDGNVKRVLSRYFLIAGPPSKASVHQELMQRAKACMPSVRSADYTQAIMDLGAMVCTTKNPECSSCPLHDTCLARIHQVMTEYPHKAPKKIKPTVKQQFLLIHTKDNKIYLEQRPNQGIWGGLWCLPAIEMNECPEHHLQSTYQIKTKRSATLPIIKHTFTHFHLFILPIILSLQHEAMLKGRWYHPEELNRVGLAKPIRSIIDRFFALDSLENVIKLNTT